MKIIGKVIQILEDAHFELIGIRMLKFTDRMAESFYSIHKDRDFFPELISYMTSGKCIALALRKDNAVSDLRNLMGDTDPLLAENGTIRNKYGKDKQYNVIHGSDSDGNAEKEVAFFFSAGDIPGNL